MALHEDQFIITPAQDELGRKELVGLIVNAIKSKVQKPHGPLTFGIYGAWGEGKTTTMRMVMHDLSEGGVSCLWFNPWSFSGKKRMVDEFFGVLASFTFPESDFSKIIPSYRETYLQVSGIQLNPVLTNYQTSLAKCLPFDANDLDMMKKKISKRLENVEKHLVVFIDDVDRLDTDEVQAMFKMIRQVVDFNNIIYVLGLDPEVVSLQLGQQYGDNQQVRGRAYLEKIVHIPVVLPAVQDAFLEELIRKEIVGVWRDSSVDVNEKDIDTVVAMLLPVMNTKRAIDRFANQLSFIVPTIAIETEFVDLCLVESLKYLDEKGWIEIYNQRKGLLKEGIMWPSGEKRDEEEKRVFTEAVNKVLDHYPEKWKAYVKSVLEGHLFPKIHSYNANNLSRCINNPTYFNQYFIAGIPIITIPRVEVLKFANLVRQDLSKAIEWINIKLTTYSSSEVERSACLVLDIIREEKPAAVAAKIIEVLAFSGLSQGFGYHTIGNPNLSDATIYGYIIPNYMVTYTSSGSRIMDMDTEKEVLAKVFKSAPLNFCMNLFTGVYDHDNTRPTDDETGLFDIIKERVLGKGKRAIFDYSFPIKRSFFVEWMDSNLEEYSTYWRGLLKEDDFDLGDVIKDWLIAVSPQGQLPEIETLAELFKPVDMEMRDNLIKSKYKEDKLVRLFVWNCGLFEKSFGEVPIYNSTEELMKNIEISESIINGENGKKVKIAFLRAVVPVSNAQAVNDMMDIAVSEYVLTAGHNTFVEENKDTPNLRVIISDLNALDFKPYNGEHLVK